MEGALPVSRDGVLVFSGKHGLHIEGSTASVQCTVWTPHYVEKQKQEWLRRLFY